MDTERLKERIESFSNACERLHEACIEPQSSFIRDSVIRRFEMCWDLAWKMLKLRLAYENIDAPTPRLVFQEALVPLGNQGLKDKILRDGLKVYPISVD